MCVFGVSPPPMAASQCLCCLRRHAVLEPRLGRAARRRICFRIDATQQHPLSPRDDAGRADDRWGRANLPQQEQEQDKKAAQPYRCMLGIRLKCYHRRAKEDPPALWAKCMPDISDFFHLSLLNVRLRRLLDQSHFPQHQ